MLTGEILNWDGSRYWRDLRPGQHYRLTRTVAPTIEPVPLGTLKQHLRVDDDSEDAVIQDYLRAAREMAETDTLRGFMPQTWQLQMDFFPDDVIELRRCPVASVTGITYIDGSGASQTLSTDLYQVNTANEPGRVTLKSTARWPTTFDQANAVTVTFTVGYPSLQAVPDRARQAIRMLVGHWFNNREAISDKGMTLPLAYEALIDRLRWSGYR